MPIDQLGDLDHEKLITAGLLLQGVKKRRRAGGRERGRKEMRQRRRRERGQWLANDTLNTPAEEPLQSVNYHLTILRQGSLSMAGRLGRVVRVSFAQSLS